MARIVPEGPAQLDDGVGDGVVAHHPARPDGRLELFAADHLSAAAGQIDEHVHHLRFEPDLLAVAREPARGRVDLPPGDAPAIAALGRGPGVVVFHGGHGRIGTWYIGWGRTYDPAKLTALPAGSYYIEPANVPHFAATRDGEAVVQITGTGPTAVHYVDPAHAAAK